MAHAHPCGSRNWNSNMLCVLGTHMEGEQDWMETLWVRLSHLVMTSTDLVREDCCSRTVEKNSKGHFGTGQICPL